MITVFRNVPNIRPALGQSRCTRLLFSPETRQICWLGTSVLTPPWVLLLSLRLEPFSMWELSPERAALQRLLNTCLFLHPKGKVILLIVLYSPHLTVGLSFEGLRWSISVEIGKILGWEPATMYLGCRWKSKVESSPRGMWYHVGPWGCSWPQDLVPLFLWF